MKQIAVLKESGEKAGELTLPESYFGYKVNQGCIYYTVKAVLANRRLGTAATKTRSQVKASTRKPWRQKGTGRARAGMRSSPLWRGGGTVFGPQPKSYNLRVPKKVRRAALCSALSAKAAQEGAIAVVENLEFAEPKTKRVVQLLENLEALDRRVLILSDGYKQLLWKSARNIPKVVVKPFAECNAYDVLLADKLIFEKSIIEKLEQKSDEGSVSDSEKAPVDGEK